MEVAGEDEVSEFDKYLTGIGKSRDTATDLDEIQWLRSERQRLRLTDAEREAIREAVGAYNDNDDDEECAKIAATLHSLLKRLG
jgi:hypothetical protein